jgi:hypothetical protein
MQYKLGRQPRTFKPAIPHLSALMGRKKLPPPPASVDYSKRMPVEISWLLMTAY